MQKQMRIQLTTKIDIKEEHQKTFLSLTFSTAKIHSYNPQKLFGVLNNLKYKNLDQELRIINLFCL